MTGITTERGQKLLAVYCMPDHTHLLVGLRPAIALSNLVRDIKNASSDFINGKGWILGHFCWQEGFGAFSSGHSQLSDVIRYVRNQPEHHIKKSFRDEDLQLLRRFEAAHDERFIFKDVNETGNGPGA